MLGTFRKDGSLNVMVESPRGSSVKFKYDPEARVMTISRPLPEGLVYPYDWGFIPSTHAPDGDPIDAVIVWDGTSYPGVVIPCRVIGALKAEQTNRDTKRRERNDRIVALPVEAPRQAHIKSVFDLSQRERDELEQFFLHAVVFQGKNLELLGWEGQDEAAELVRTSRSPRRWTRRRQRRA
jgi:inorganic pyrophosphatase